jgi:hypothetical protein
MGHAEYNTIPISYYMDPNSNIVTGPTIRSKDSCGFPQSSE